MTVALRPHRHVVSAPYYLVHPELTGRTYRGPFDTCSREEALTLLPGLPEWPAAVHDRNELVEGTGWVLDWLSQQPGAGWRDRWVAAGANTDPTSWIAQEHGADQRTASSVRAIAIGGMRSLILAKVLLPDYPYFRACTTWKGFRQAIGAQDPDLVAGMKATVRADGMSARSDREAWVVLAKIVLHTGRDLPQLTAEDVFEYRSSQMLVLNTNSAGCRAAWSLLVAGGVLPRDSSLQAALRRGQRSPAELVDRYGLQCQAVRDLLVRYLEERKTAVDYSTLKGLAGVLAGTFWADLERHHLGIDSIQLPGEVITGWKERLKTVTTRDGTTRERSDFLDLLLTVRCFYLDLRDWAMEDPSLVSWAVPSPIRAADIAGTAKRKLRSRARIHQRIRERVALMPELVGQMETQLREATELLRLATETPIGNSFAHAGHNYVRVGGTIRSGLGSTADSSYDVRVTETGKRLSAARVEDDAFWTWAMVETLRHTGLRIEELLELTHLALISYRLSTTGELVPLLQVVPSKTNEERLLLVTPELASVLATIISRLRNRYGAVPLVARYDNYEATTGPRLPHLFQRDFAFGPASLNPTVARQMLRHAVAKMGFTDQAGEPVHFTPHDFRRIFTTEAVQNGLPLHIASRLLGHRHLNSIDPYLAVFQDDLIRTYRRFVDKRRATRPPEEYRQPTDAEWDEFEEHFVLRKVELGSCARPYGTSCQHEHACIRCPVLRVDPRQLQRLEAITTNLAERIVEAEQRGWAGEAQQLQVSLNAARDKLSKTTSATEPVSLQMPVLRARS